MGRRGGEHKGEVRGRKGPKGEGRKGEREGRKGEGEGNWREGVSLASLRGRLIEYQLRLG